MRARYAIVFLLFLTVYSFSGVTIAERRSIAISPHERDCEVLLADSYSPHGPITISSNADFASQGWPGNGSIRNPFVIEGLNITNSSECISISNTDVHFEIRNCLISAPSSSNSEGIYFSHVANGTVRDCVINLHRNGILLSYFCDTCTLTNNTVINNIGEGYLLSESSNCILTNNTAINNVGGGFRLWYLTSFTLTNNSAVNNSKFGFILGYSSDCHLTKNTAILNIESGFQLTESSDCRLTNNTATSNLHGYYLYDSSTCNLTSNTATLNNEHGFYFDISDGVLTNNTALFNGIHGFYLHQSSNCIFSRNSAISNAEDGFSLYESSHTVMINNTAEHNLLGFNIVACFGCSFNNNTMINTGLVMRGFNVLHWIHEVSDNIVNDKPLGYFKSVDNMTVDGTSYGQIILANCTNIEVMNGEFHRASGGIILGFCTNCSLLNNIVTDSYYGVYFYNTNDCSITNNTAETNYYGFYIAESSLRILTNNTAATNEYGFLVGGCSDTVLTNNTATRNWIGFYIDFSTTCTLTKNTAGFNDFGIYLDHFSTGTLLFLNILHNNSQYNGYDDCSSNNWDNGVVGNYWDDLDNSTTQYLVPGSAGSVDNFPLDFYALLDDTPPTIDSPKDIEYEHGTGGASITWSPSDLYPMSYIIYLEDSVAKSGLWNSSSEVISILVTGLNVGAYSYTIIVSDMRGNSANDTVLVTVVDTTPPVIDSPVDLEYEYGTEGSLITWSPSDLNPSSYVIYWNGSEVKAGSWNSTSEVITILVDNLDIGVYNYTIEVYDMSGNSASDTVLVTVIDVITTTTTPTTTTPTTTTPTTLPDSGLGLTLILAISGSIAIIIVVVIIRRRF